MEPAEASDKSPTAGDPCPVCGGEGSLKWQQAMPGGGELRDMEIPCPHGCGDHWTHPHAERRRVVEQRDDAPERPRGLADEADHIGADFIRAALENWGFGPRRQ